MTVIRETEKEFQASLQTSKEALANLNTEKQTEHDEDDDFDDFGDIEEDNYTAEDILIVEPSLQILNCTFRFLKELLNLITEWSESPLLQTDQISPISPSESTFPLQYGVSLLYHHVTSMKNIIVDIGVELYTTPIEIMKLQSKVNELFGKYETIFQEIDRIENSSGSEEKNILRRQVVSVIRNSLHSIDIEARLANTSMRIGPS